MRRIVSKLAQRLWNCLIHCRSLQERSRRCGCPFIYSALLKRPLPWIFAVAFRQQLMILWRISFCTARVHDILRPLWEEIVLLDSSSNEQDLDIIPPVQLEHIQVIWQPISLLFAYNGMRERVPTQEISMCSSFASLSTTMRFVFIALANRLKKVRCREIQDRGIPLLRH